MVYPDTICVLTIYFNVQGRALAARVAETERIQFFCGTQSLKHENQVHVCVRVYVCMHVLEQYCNIIVTTQY